MGFMSGFFGSAATTFAESRERQLERERQDRAEDRRIKLQETEQALRRNQSDSAAVERYYTSTMQNWSTMTAGERAQARNSLEALGTEYNTPSIQAYLGLMDSQIRESMKPSEARAFLANLVTTPLDLENPYGVIPKWIADEALSILEASEDPLFEEIRDNVDQYLKNRELDVTERVAPGVWVDQELKRREREAIIDEIRSRTALNDANVVAQTIVNGYLDDRQREELRGLIKRNELDEALFDSIVADAEASVGIKQSNLRVLMATEAFEIAIKEGQAEQVPFLLEQLQANIRYLNADTQRILLNNEITEGTKEAEIALSIERARLARSQANVAEATEEAEISRILSESRRAMANATMDELRADQYGQELAANLAQVLALTATTQADVALKRATFEDAVKKYAAETNIAESTARVYLVTEAFRIAAAEQEPEQIRAQIANLWSNANLNNTQADLALPRMISDLISAGQTATLAEFGQQLLEPRFGENWEAALKTIQAAAANAKNVQELQTSVEIGYRQALTLQSVATTEATRASMVPQAARVADVLKSVKDSGYPSIAEIRNAELEITELESAMEAISDVLRQGGDIQDSLASSIPLLLNILGLETNMFEEVSREAAELMLGEAQVKLDSRMARSASDMAVYMRALQDAGIGFDMTTFGLDQQNPTDVAMYNRARWRQPDVQLDVADSIFWERGYGDAFMAALTPLQTLYAPTMYHHAQGLTDIETLMAPILDELRTKMGPEAWETAGAPTGQQIYDDFFEKEIERYGEFYNDVKNSVRVLSNIGIEVNPDDRKSLIDAARRINDMSAAAEAIQTSALRRLTGLSSTEGFRENANFLFGNVLSGGGVGRTEDNQILLDFMKLYNLTPEVLIAEGIASGHGPVDFHRHPTVFQDINLGALVAYSTRLTEYLTSSVDAITNLYSRYPR